MQVQELEEAAAEYADCRLCVVCARSGKVSIMKICRSWAAALGRLQCLAGLIMEGAEKQSEGFVLQADNLMLLSESDGCLAWHRVSGRRYSA